MMKRLTMTKIRNKQIGLDYSNSDPFWFGMCNYLRTESVVCDDVANDVCKGVERPLDLFHNDIGQAILDGIYR